MGLGFWVGVGIRDGVGVGVGVGIRDGVGVAVSARRSVLDEAREVKPLTRGALHDAAEGAADHLVVWWWSLWLSVGVNGESMVGVGVGVGVRVGAGVDGAESVMAALGGAPTSAALKP